MQDQLNKLQEQIFNNAHKLHSMGHDQTDTFKALNYGADDGKLSRLLG